MSLPKYAELIGELEISIFFSFKRENNSVVIQFATIFAESIRALSDLITLSK